MPQPSRLVTDWTYTAEVGEVVIHRDWPCILKESRGRNKRDAGELHPQRLRPPCGKTGDLLWVRETFCCAATSGFDARDDGGEYWYRATDAGQVDTEDGGWLPSIHMPKRACRLWLKVKSIRVERVQDISVEDVLAEGLRNTGEGWGPEGRLGSIAGFKDLWNSINAKRGLGWEVNPWVWVIEFERKKPE